MKPALAINGFGRIGRLILRAAIETKRDDISIIAINNRSSIETAAHLIKYDSIHGTFNADIRIENQTLYVNQHAIRVFCETEPQNIPWQTQNIDIVLECTGKFKKREDAQKHIDAGAKKILISAPAKNPDATIVFGINHHILKSNHKIVSCASCTTNCLVPLAYVIHKNFNIQTAHATTIHAYTTDQRLLDNSHKDFRRARAAALSLIPTSTGAANAVGEILPELKGRIEGAAIRVPTPNVSMVDLVAHVQKPSQSTNLTVSSNMKHTINSNTLSIFAACPSSQPILITIPHPVSSIPHRPKLLRIINKILLYEPPHGMIMNGHSLCA